MMSDGASQRSCGARRGILKVKEPCRYDERRRVTTKLWWPSRNLEGEGTLWGRDSYERAQRASEWRRAGVLVLGIESVFPLQEWANVLDDVPLYRGTYSGGF